MSDSSTGITKRVPKIACEPRWSQRDTWREISASCWMRFMICCGPKISRSFGKRYTTNSPRFSPSLRATIQAARFCFDFGVYGIMRMNSSRSSSGSFMIV